MTLNCTLEKNPVYRQNKQRQTPSDSKCQVWPRKNKNKQE